MSNWLLFLFGYAFFLVDGKTGYPVGGSDRRLRTGAGPRPGGRGLAGWTDDIVVFGGIGIIATIGLFLILKRKKH